jgi:transcriptional regulator with XRE-family HTH domain
MSRQMQYILSFDIKSGGIVEPDYKQIGNRVRQARKNTGLTQAELGEKVELTQGMINKIETGLTGATLENLYKLAGVLNCPVTYFLGLDVGDLNQDEGEVVDIYRSLPEGLPREYGRKMLRSWADQIRDS